MFVSLLCLFVCLFVCCITIYHDWSICLPTSFGIWLLTFEITWSLTVDMILAHPKTSKLHILSIEKGPHYIPNVLNMKNMFISKLCTIQWGWLTSRKYIQYQATYFHPQMSIYLSGVEKYFMVLSFGTDIISAQTCCSFFWCRLDTVPFHVSL